MHPHDHSHSHAGASCAPADYNRAFAIGVALNVAFVICEAVFGVLADSVALLADAGHNLSDVLGLLLAWGASYLVRLQPTHRRTYGWRSSTIMAALINAAILLVAVGAIAWESVRRFVSPEPVAGKIVLVVAVVGVVINTVTALLFLSGRKKDLNIRGAFLHMAADAAVSAGVAAAGIAILITGRLWIDPAVSLAIALVILFGTWGLLRESLALAMHAVPPGVDTDQVITYLSDLPGIEAIHDLHIWAMSTTETALTAHLVKPNPEGDDEMIGRIADELYDRFGIGHVTLQWERTHDPCRCSNGSCLR
ncbi:MAG: cation diffusion facilitator family transporter [Desulfobacterales bacterium]|nr:cation diffusion facilitator family transporter [Desulfobacterales bacterium]MCF8079674.1 cation diffusion facilitator family transporter [Desulfobacterales bacterium]